jgi:NAD(P)-dependent dehydrogenase (short-subunit alcohol dehydrogenase family)
MLSIDLQQHVVAITGGFGALGSTLARRIAEAGARVAVIDQLAQPTQSLAAGTLILGNVNLAEPAAAQSAMDKIVRDYGQLDALVNVAGGFRWEKIEGGSVESWDRMFALNLRSAVVASQAALPHLLRRPSASVVNIGAGAAQKAGLGMGAYTASKAGVARLTEAMAEEFKDRGITVNAVLPSVIDTPANRADIPSAEQHRWVKAEEIADLICFLLSDRARAITGSSIAILGRV